MKISEAITTDELTRCFEVMKDLRPQLTRENFLASMAQMKNEHYHLLYIEDDGRVVCTAGFRFTTTLYDGLIIDIDDLVTITGERNKGYAGYLFDHLISAAEKKSIKAIHLNSNHLRYDAHRFYLNKKMKMIAHHFRIEL